MGAKNLVDMASDFISASADALPDRRMASACWRALYDERFRISPGSAGKHHAFRGGLLVHTAEVLAQALAMGQAMRADISVLTTAAIFHDFAKVSEYEIAEGGTISKTRYRNLIRHVSGSYHLFCVTATEDGIPEPIAAQVGHCILAHHGRLEWGSPVEPQTAEAHILHYADMLSSRFGAGSADEEPRLIPVA